MNEWVKPPLGAATWLWGTHLVMISSSLIRLSAPDRHFYLSLPGVWQLCRMGSERHWLCGRWLRYTARSVHFFFSLRSFISLLHLPALNKIFCSAFFRSSQAHSRWYISFKIKRETKKEKVGFLFIYLIQLQSVACSDLSLSADGIRSFYIHILEPPLPYCALY